jgi:hypothetical protein
MLQLPTKHRPRTPTIRLSPRTTRLVWLVALSNGMNVVWMAVLGGWFDQQSHLLSLVTWGGHHRLVLTAAVCALVGHALLAPLTKGFSEASADLMMLTIGACFLALLAMFGVLALAAPLIIVGLFIGIVGWMLG